MTSATDVDKIMKRTQAAWYEDGLADLTMGGYFAVVGLYLLAQTLTPAGSPLWLLWGTGGPLIIILGGVAAAAVLRRLKTRLVFPRTGYVQFESQKRGVSFVARMLLVVVLSALVAAGVVVVQGRLSNLSLIFGLVGFGTFIFLWQRLGLTRYLALAVWSAVVGAALAPIGLTMEQGGAAFWLLVGGALMATGLIIWQRFSRLAPEGDGNGQGGVPGEN